MEKHQETLADIKSLLNNKELNKGFIPNRRHFSPRDLKEHGLINIEEHHHEIARRHEHQHEIARRHEHPLEKARIHNQNEVILKRRSQSKEVQWGYLSIPHIIKDYKSQDKKDKSAEPSIKDIDNKPIADGHLEKYAKGLLFINNTNFEPLKGEEKRTMFYDVKDVEVKLDNDTSITIQVAYNFDYVTKDPPHPKKHFKNGDGKWEEQDFFPQEVK